jgi:HD-like signal output (HDOD) protein
MPLPDSIRDPSLRQEFIDLEHLPPLTPVATRLLAVTADPDLAINELAAIIEQDPPLTARILGLANSAFFGQVNPIFKVEHAIIRVMGLNMVRSLALSIALTGSFDTRQCRSFDPSTHWLNALATSALAAAIGRRLAANPWPSRVDALHLAGLLHNIGTLALVHVRPIQMAEVFEQEMVEQGPADYLPERAILGVDRWQAGQWLALRWHLPEVVLHTLAALGEASYQGPYAEVTGIVKSAHRWVHDHLRGAEVTLSVPGISDELAAAAEHEVTEQLKDLRAMAAMFT